jgi:hypothetical protein
VFGLVDSLARRLVRRGLRDGLIGGSTVWAVVGAAAWLARLLLRREEPLVVREDLKLGERIVVAHVPPPPTRAELRRARRQRRKVRGAVTTVRAPEG